jgi:para-aminobenzoate synthetase/4-amino-4-deoxychorismate lyase
VAGYFAYDAGLGLDRGFTSRHPSEGPLVWLGVYEACDRMDADSVDVGPSDSPGDVYQLRMNVEKAEYQSAVERVKRYIEAGDVYQINYTAKLKFEHTGTACGMFARLRRAHPVDHSAWINTGERQIISLSPELFLRREADRVLTRPMKGTSRRGRWFEEDAALGRALAADEKNRAENVMIVDLMRNDLGRVCRLGSVHVPQVLHVDRYRSLFQMTSDVVGRLRDGVNTGTLLRAVFPPGSVTGAPKLRALEIIDELERESRGVYCGAIGLFRPGGDCLLNVAIRTIVRQGRQCEMGVGSGVVADSDAEAEWEEANLKGRFLGASWDGLELIETMGVLSRKRLEMHLERMRRSAEYFSWAFPEDRIREAISRVTGEGRARVLLSEDGRCRVETSPLPSPAERPVKAMLAARRTDPNDVFLYHKTTRRTAYDADWQEARRRGCFDLVYRNIRGEITEGAITNLVAKIDGRQVTPPLPCGLLPGIWRAERLATGEVAEAVIMLDDLLRAERIVLGNSVRGGVEIDVLVDADGHPVWHRAGHGLCCE